MFIYKTKKGKFVCRAWSEMTCSKARAKEDHKPHLYESEYFNYGPYCCPGFPEKKLKRS